MESEYPTQGRALELPPPGEQPSDGNRKRGSRCHGEVVVSGSRPNPVTPSQGDQIEQQRDHHERNGEMHQHHVLRMLCQDGVLQVKKMHGYFTTIFPVIFGCTEQ